MLRRGRGFPDAGRGIGATPPGHVVKLGLLSKGSEKTVTLTLGTMPDERQAMQPRRKRECR
jgi:S1-C subfamily serine protease